MTVEVAANIPYGLCGHKATLKLHTAVRAQKRCESQAGRPGLSIPDSPHGLCGHKAMLNLNFTDHLRW